VLGWAGRAGVRPMSKGAGSSGSSRSMGEVVVPLGRLFERACGVLAVGGWALRDRSRIVRFEFSAVKMASTSAMRL